MLRFGHNKNSGQRIASYTEQEETIASGAINGGLVSRIDPADLENGQLSNLQNATVRIDRVSRRIGAYPYNTLDANKVVGLASIYGTSGAGIVRFTRNSIYIITQAGSTLITGTALSAALYDKFSSAFINGRFFFADSGADNIQEINLGANTYAALGNAPKYKYITSFNNRILAANLAGNSPKNNQIGWSGNLNFGVWDTITDISAGFSVLVDSTFNTDDPINGLFGLDEVALCLRQHSLWGISKAPIATAPFVFYVLHPNLGCDAPASAVPIKNGIAWYDSFTNNVYVYKVGNREPEPIADPINDLLLASLTDLQLIEGSYDPINEEYNLLFTSKTSTYSQCYTYNFKNKSWTYHLYNNVTTIAVTKISTLAAISINGIVGTIDSLTSTIDNLNSSTDMVTKFLGYNNGTIAYETPYQSDNGYAFTTYITSKLFKLPRYSPYVSGMSLEYVAQLAGSFTVQYSKDAGVTFIDWKTITIDTLNTRKRVTFKKHIRANTFMWRIVATSGQFDIMGYEVFVIPSKADTRSY